MDPINNVTFDKYYTLTGTVLRIHQPLSLAQRVINLFPQVWQHRAAMIAQFILSQVFAFIIGSILSKMFE